MFIKNHSEQYECPKYPSMCNIAEFHNIVKTIHTEDFPAKHLSRVPLFAKNIVAFATGIFVVLGMMKNGE